MQKKKRIGLHALWILWIVLVFLPGTALARGPLEVERPTSLTMEFPCAGTGVRLFRVASVDRYARYAVTPAFSAYAAMLSGVEDEAGWQALAETLAGYVARDGVTPDAEAKADADGQVAFAGLPAGLYLVLADAAEKEEMVYQCAPFLVALPGLDADDKWVYDVTATPKYERIPLRELMDEKQVIKVWKDGNATSRPDHVDIQLLCDGVVWDTVTLSAQNNWRHTWKRLGKGHVWQVVEKDVPAGYTVSVERDGDVFTVTNRKPAGPQDPRLPQTGVLWWPVSLLAAGGMALFLLGWSQRRHGRGEK